MNEVRKSAFINALLTSLYIVGIGLFMYYGSTIKIGRVNSFLAPITFLSLFVCSAAITGYLIFGKPVQMYIDRKKKESLSLLFNTFGFFFAFTLISVALLLSFTR